MKWQAKAVGVLILAIVLLPQGQADPGQTDTIRCDGNAPLSGRCTAKGYFWTPEVRLDIYTALGFHGTITAEITADYDPGRRYTRVCNFPIAPLLTSCSLSGRLVSEGPMTLRGFASFDSVGGWAVEAST